MFRRIPRGKSVGWALAVLVVSAIGADSARAAEPRQFLFGTATKVAEVSEPGVPDASPNLTPDELELFFGRGDDLYEVRRASNEDSFGQPVRIDELNLPDGAERGPSISPDGLTLYFFRGPELPLPDEIWGEIWVATRPSREAPFDPPVNLSEAWGLTGDTYTTPEVTADGLNLYVTYWPEGADPSIYVASRTAIDQPWDLPQLIPELIEAGARCGISADGMTLFFETRSPTSRLPAGWAGNIVVSQRASVNDPWSESVNLGDAINGNLYNTEPYLTHDGTSLYYWSAQFLSDKSDIEINSIDIYQAPVLPFTAVPLSGQGGAYEQGFDSLGDTSKAAAQLFPDGWTFTANDVIFNDATTRRFPAAVRNYAGAFNVGTSGEGDRALATNVTEQETGQLQFRAQVEGGPVQALRLAVDVEAWQVSRSLASQPGEAAFEVSLDADVGKGFEKVADLGVATIGPELEFPKNGSASLNGNDSANRGSFDTGPLDLNIPAGATLRLRFVPTGASLGWTFGLDNLSLHLAAPGDANVDGNVDLADFGILKAHFGTQGAFTSGDFGGNGQVDLADFGLLKENFGRVGGAAVPEPATIWLSAVAALFVVTSASPSLRGRAGTRGTRAFLTTSRSTADNAVPARRWNKHNRPSIMRSTFPRQLVVAGAARNAVPRGGKPHRA